MLTQTDAKAVCLTCHDDKAKQIDGAKVPHPGAMGDCTDCHSPHASNQPGLPKTDSVSICLGCHNDIDELRKKPAHHQPAFAQGCSTCHTPHGGDNDHLLRAKGNALCLECHGPDSVPQRQEAEHLLTIFNGTGQAARRLLQEEQGRDPAFAIRPWDTRWSITPSQT